MKKKQSGLTSKFFLYMLGFCLLMLVVLWLFQTVFLDSFYRSIKLGQIEKVASTLAGYVQQGNMDALAAEVQERGDMFVELWDADGNSYVISGRFPEGAQTSMEAEQKKELFEIARQNGGAVTLNPSSGTFPTPEQDAPGMIEPKPGFSPAAHMRENILYAEIVTTANNQEILLLINATLTPVSATVETLRIQLLYISGIMLVVAAVLAFLLARRVSKPIVQLNRAAKQLGKGDYSVSFNGEGYREIGELAGTLNHAAKELGKTEELRRELIANVSHDLRTPLTLITGYAEVIRDIPGEDTPENMQVIIDEASRLSTLVSDLLDLSRIQSGTMEMRLEPFNLTQETTGIIERFKKFGEPKGLQVAWEAKESVDVCADEVRIAQVLYNFLINAANYCGKDKTICVRQRLEGSRVRLEVADHGVGIDAEDLPYIWDRYYKVDKVHTRSVTGSGLGLSIAKNILEQHPGVEYGVESSLGEGSTFWFSLPVYTP